MRKGMKGLAVTLSAAALVGVSVFGTMAYLTSQDTVVNTFTVGNVQLELDEKDVDDSTKDADRDKENAYHLLPNGTYEKDPTVTVKEGSEDCYVRAMVTINNKTALDEIFASHGGDADEAAIFGGWDSDVWSLADETDDGDTHTYELRYVGTKATNGIVENPDKLEPVFTTINIPNWFTGDDLAKLKNFNITVVAHAIQAEGFDDASEAWAAFDASAPTN